MVSRLALLTSRIGNRLRGWNQPRLLARPIQLTPIPRELIPLPSSCSIPDHPNVANVENCGARIFRENAKQKAIADSYMPVTIGERPDTTRKAVSVDMTWPFLIPGLESSSPRSPCWVQGYRAALVCSKNPGIQTPRCASDPARIVLFRDNSAACPWTRP